MFDRSEKKILLVTVAGHALDHLSELSFPAVALLVSQEFFAGQENYERIGLAATVMAFAFGVANLPSGRLVDRIGSRRVMLLYLLGTGAALILTGLAPTFPLLLVALGLLGLTAGLYHPSGNTLLSLGVREQGRAMGIHGVGGNFGLALSPFLTAALASALGWRHAYYALSVPFFLLALIVWRVKVGRRSQWPAPLRGVVGREEIPVEKKFLLWPLVFLFGMAVMNGLCYRGFLTFLPAYFAKNIHSSLGIREVLLGGTLSTAVLLLGMIGQYLGGRFADRFSPALLYALIFTLGAPILFFLGRLQNLPLLLCAAAFAFLYFANQPVGNVLLIRLTTPSIRGQLFGLFFFINFGAGSLMGWVAGIIGQRLSLSAIFSVLALCLVMAGAIGLGLILSVRGQKRI
jgi:MFS family permease